MSAHMQRDVVIVVLATVVVMAACHAALGGTVASTVPIQVGNAVQPIPPAAPPTPVVPPAVVPKMPVAALGTPNCLPLPGLANVHGSANSLSTWIIQWCQEPNGMLSWWTWGTPANIADAAQIDALHRAWVPRITIKGGTAPVYVVGTDLSVTPLVIAGKSQTVTMAATWGNYCTGANFVTADKRTLYSMGGIKSDQGSNLSIAANGVRIAAAAECVITFPPATGFTQ